MHEVLTLMTMWEEVRNASNAQGEMIIFIPFNWHNFISTSGVPDIMKSGIVVFLVGR